MRSFLSAALCIAPFFTYAIARPHEVITEQPTEAKGITVLEYTPGIAYTKFSIPCQGCFSEPDAGADESLVFELFVSPATELEPSIVAVNNQHLDILWQDIFAEGSQVLSVEDTYGFSHRVNISWIGFIGPPPPSLFREDYVTQNIHFYASLVQGVDKTLRSTEGFVAIMRPTSEQNRLVGLIPDNGAHVIDFENFKEVKISSEPVFDHDDHEIDALQSIHWDDSEVEEPKEDNNFDLGAELESLNLLEVQAHQLQSQIAAKKHAIAHNVKTEREKLCLKHLIKECDGLICKAKAVAQRICDKVGIPNGPSFQYAHMGSQHAFDPKSHPQGLMLTKNGTHPFHPIHLPVDVERNVLFKALSVISAVLGLTALFTFVKKRCMSQRKRAERAADLEEKRNKRSYRRAARRALMRKRWDNLASALNCFGRKKDRRIEDYEEKRALILQDAFLEQDLDQAEKGDVMEAEIRELRYAHEIVSSLVRVDENRYGLNAPINDPPPPLVPLPYTPASRSRATSLYTLPSYTSESLPDYTSRPGDTESESSVVDGFTPPTTNEDGRCSPISRISARSSHTGYTPDSSVRDTSPRASEETLRTRPSRDLQR